MVRSVARGGVYSAWTVAGVIAGAVAGMTCKSEPPRTGAQLASAVQPSAMAATSGGEFRYSVVDGVPVVGWYAADGKQVILLRVDSRWVCDLSSGQLHCGPRQAASVPCTSCALATCPCADARCLPMCLANATVAPGLHDPAAAPP